jgi:hypothetical protein
MAHERLVEKIDESIQILERFRSCDFGAGLDPEAASELVGIHGHALALERLTREHVGA